MGVDYKNVVIVHVEWGWSKKTMSGRRVTRRERVLRPCAIDTNDTALEEAVWIRILDVGYVPPYLLHPREHRGCQTEPGEEKYGRIR
jgi:hypothetical protein